MKNLIIGLVLYTAAVLGLGAIAVGQTTGNQEKREPQLVVDSPFSEITSQNLFHRPLSIEHGITDKWQLSLESNAASRLTRSWSAFPHLGQNITLETVIRLEKFTASR